jgi:DNA primase large subunit
MNLYRLAKYPFLQDTRNWVKKEGITLEEILWEEVYERARLIGRIRLENALTQKEVGERSLANETDCMMEIFSYPIARMIAAGVGDSYLKRRYSLAEAKTAHKHLKAEPLEFLATVMDEFGIEIAIGADIKIFFTEYLKYSPARSRKWKLVNRPLKAGMISLQKIEVVRLIQEALGKRIFEEIEMAAPSAKIRDALADDIIKIRNMVAVHREKFEEIRGTEDVSIVRFPPCMKKLLGAMQSGVNIPHMARFSVVAFLNALGLDTDKILTLFASSPDFDKGKSRYQVEHITGKRSGTEYTAPKCSSLKTWGLCPGEDDICREISHPLSYYRRKRK